MEAVWPIVGYVALGACALAGLIITPLGLPGNWFILGGAVVCGFSTQWAHYGWAFMALIAVAAVFGEIIEAASSAIGARKFGASKGATVAAIVGSLIGLSLGTGLMPIVGTLIGAFAGAFLGAFIYEYIKLQDIEQALRAGLGAFLGRTAAIIVKETIGILMVGAIIYQVLA
jgi:hypothetical protein